jgi:hypothetical protein
MQTARGGAAVAQGQAGGAAAAFPAIPAIGAPLQARGCLPGCPSQQLLKGPGSGLGGNCEGTLSSGVNPYCAGTTSE